MGIENIMYFALGLLAASLLALIVLPAVWKRAARLTKRRIEAATPITMAEFRADKDQLRAQFALNTRRLETTVETLRNRLAEQLGSVNQDRSDLGALRAERQQRAEIVAELEAREAELRARTQELEREGTDLAQRLRMRDRDIEVRDEELEELRDTLRGGLPKGTDLDGNTLSGDYEADTDRLVTALAIERKRAAYLEEQARSLISRLENSDRRSAEANAAIAEMREAISADAGERYASAENLVAAEARIASAETRLTELLAQAGPTPDEAPAIDEELEKLRARVEGVESIILADWTMDQSEEGELRARLHEIASSVSRLVYAADTEPPPAAPQEESLFDRVQRFADEESLMAPPPPKATRGTRRGSVADRLTALKEIQGR
ncbi:coiled-coil domain-containing protein [Devosia epidermidihirudinis]|uniref:hypothetical protein n=1 Tax=Devosia epidermidihirudinis TaxID=1293439 RepID=UPI000695A84E|nr:hypothetical protein [Devosia epidermidihirudinis]